ncbi:biopolymer transporter ExbD [bacterium]|nr:biopolymer transporter ExbD [bacterium]
MKMRRSSRIPPLVPVASMGDIAFLLIIFFIVTTNFIKEAHVQVDQAAAPGIAELEESQIAVSLDKNGDLWLQGQPCPVEILEEGVSALLAEREDKVVMLKIDRTAVNKDYGAIFLALSRAGAEIALIGSPENE